MFLVIIVFLWASVYTVVQYADVLVVLLFLVLCLAETLVSVNRGMKYMAAQVCRIDEKLALWLIKNWHNSEH
jgi:hypothetical protein